jgi:hypothetical protein
MKLGQQFWLLGELYEVVAKSGDSVYARKTRAPELGLFWLFESDIPIADASWLAMN